jgi:hypothetical protein
MFMISEVRNIAKKFLQETLEAEVLKIVRIDKTDGGGWIATAEVADKNQYLASINPAYRVFEKEYYSVKLNSKLEVSSYKRVRSAEEEQEGSGYEL